LEDYLNENDDIKDKQAAPLLQQEPQTSQTLLQNTNNNQQISIMTNSPQQITQNPFLDIMNQQQQPSTVMNPPFATMGYEMSKQMVDTNPFRSLGTSSYNNNANNRINNQQMNTNKLEIYPFSQQLTGITNNSTNPFSTVPTTPPLTPNQPLNSFAPLQIPQSTTNNYPPPLNPFSQYSSLPSAF
jgi:hypothetical protein